MLDLCPETVAINSASIELVETVDYSLLLLYTAPPKRLIIIDQKYILDTKHVACEV